MTLIDGIQIASVVFSIYGIKSWRKLRYLPLTIGVILAFVLTILFYLARTFDLLTPLELNLFSSIRVLLLVIPLSVVPNSLRPDKKP